MLTIAGGILIAAFILWLILKVDNQPTIDEYCATNAGKRTSSYGLTIWGPRIIVFGIIVALLIILFRLI